MGAITTMVFCMWLMWICVFMHQMYPIIDPILEVHKVKENPAEL